MKTTTPPRILTTILTALALTLCAAGNQDIVTAARAQVGVTLYYVPAYKRIPYPNGDVPRSEGVCVDVVIRALRDARGVDLQKLVHEDMKAHFSKYPQNWGLTRTDPNIDHRRVPNLQCYFKRRGWSLPVTKEASDYRPGDLVTCMVTVGTSRTARELPHIMVVSDKRSSKGIPLVIHNIGSGAQEEDSLFTYRLTGHYRVK